MEVWQRWGTVAPWTHATLERMADLVVEFGANVQPGQRVHIGATIGQEPLARAIAARCYRAGAVFVNVAYRDPYVQRARLDDAVDEALGYEPGWVVADDPRARRHERGARSALRARRARPARRGRSRPDPAATSRPGAARRSRT